MAYAPHKLVFKSELPTFKIERPLEGLEEKTKRTDKDLFALESNHETSINLGSGLSFSALFRQACVTFILEVQESYNLDPMLTYLAINYVDRYLHSRELAQDDKIAVIAATCLSLAAKTLKSPAFSIDMLTEKHGMPKYSVQKLGKLEHVLTSVMGYNLRSITPFAFLNFFIAGYFSSVGPAAHYEALKSRASDILIQVQHVESDDVLAHRPSIIAATALLCAVSELFPDKLAACRVGIQSCEYIDKFNLLKNGRERLESCYEAVKEKLASISEAKKKKRTMDYSDEGQAKMRRWTD